MSRLEERIRYVVDSRERVQQRIAELRGSNAQWAQRQDEARTGLEQVAQRIEQAQEHGELLSAQAEELSAALPAHDDAWRQAQSAVSEQRLEVAQVQQQIQLLAAQSRSQDEQARQLQARRERLATERQGLAPPDTARLEQQRAAFEAAEAACEAADARLHALQEELPTLDERRREQQAQANHESARQAEIAARLAALRALQERVQTEGRLQPWLARHGLQGLAGLWTRLHVEPGWESALESALRERLNALEISRLETVRAFAGDAPPARLAFYHAPSAVTPAPQRALPCLADKLRLGDATLRALLTEWLEGVYTAPTLDEALAQRGSLTHGESIVTPEGHAVSLHAVAFYAPDSEQAGMLARAQEIENLDRQLRAQALLSEDARAALVRLDAAFTEGSQQLAQARRASGEAQARAHQLQVELLRLTQLSEAAQYRRAQLGQDLDEIDAQLAAWQERREEEQGRFDELDIQLGTEQERLAELEEAAIEAERRLGEARQQHRSRERDAQEAAFEVRALHARAEELQRVIQTAEEQARQATQAGEQLEMELGTLDDAAAQAGLQEALARRLERERALAAVRSEYDDLSARLRAAEEQRLVRERSLEPLRERIQALQLQAQAARLGGAQYLEQLMAAQADLQALAAGIEQGGVRVAGLQGEIDRLQREVAALGPVNLAALQELSEGRERKGFLDAQQADLREAITTLENAIRRIDLETRDLLRQTFDQVNDHFGRLFPTLFGGGSARLVMTGDEILDAGVQVMAQPPGKRNSTIHLLSGGEKALTAIALVFAIFHLNPAPFCLLDEVDAPLDDANTERYSRLVTEMSQGTQFLFISHNRIAMEMAEQLIGVTMQEQGVSRIVAVDMQAAVGLAEAA